MIQFDLLLLQCLGVNFRLGEDVVIDEFPEVLNVVHPGTRYPDILPGFYSDKRTWISCLLDGELPEEVLRDLCGRSYALAVEKLPKYVRRELAEQPAES